VLQCRQFWNYVVDGQAELTYWTKIENINSNVKLIINSLLLELYLVMESIAWRSVISCLSVIVIYILYKFANF
jgi:hypothetical protein